MGNPGTQTVHLDGVRILDLFAGPGGLDVAAHFLRYKSIGIELDRNACETRYAAGLPTIHADVSAMRRDRFDEIPKSVDTLVGGPPCQSFSVAGNGAGRQKLHEVKKFLDALVMDRMDEVELDRKLKTLDHRTALVLEPLRWLLKAIETDGRDPYKVIVLEQVPAVRPLWDVYAKLLSGGEGRLAGVKYETHVQELKTEEFGVPQTRTRAVLVARLPDAQAFAPITETHLPFDLMRGRRDRAQTGLFPGDSGIGGTKRRWVSMAEALDAAAELPNSPLKLGRLRAGGKTSFFVVSNYGSGGNPRNRGRRLSSEPAFTVTGKISRNRIYMSDADHENGRFDRFTIPEAGILQTFPHNYPWSGNDQSQQVGNAVPPRLGMHILSMALRGALPSEQELNSASTWPDVPLTEQARLRRLGCGDQSDLP